jgi:hypothetical protein
MIAELDPRSNIAYCIREARSSGYRQEAYIEVCTADRLWYGTAMQHTLYRQGTLIDNDREFIHRSQSKHDRGAGVLCTGISCEGLVHGSISRYTDPDRLCLFCVFFLQHFSIVYSTVKLCSLASIAMTCDRC